MTLTLAIIGCRTLVLALAPALLYLAQLPPLVSETLHFLRFQPKSFHYNLRWIILAGSLSPSFSRRICW